MTTELKGPLKRAITIGQAPYILTITPEGFKLVPKGKRKGYELSWSAVVSGDAALAVALQASVGLQSTDSAPEKSARSERAQRRAGDRSS